MYFILVFLGLVVLAHTASYNETEALYKTITSGKNIDIRPVLDHRKPVMVSVVFGIVYIQEFDEVNGKLSITGIFTIYWKDETVSWNATENGIYSFTYVGDKLWKPTFLIGNSYDEVKFIYKDDSVKRVQHNGDMYWSPADNYQIACEADVSKYPFDSHECSIWFMPYGYSNDEIIVTHFADKIHTHYFTKHKTWELVGTGVAKIDRPQILYFSLKLKRIPLFFVLTFILPICVMSILNIFVFLLPAESGERIGYAITVLLAIAVFLTICSDTLPATSKPRISSISLLLFTDVSLSAVIVILVIIGLRFYHRDEHIQVSTTGKGFVKFVRCLQCKCHKNNNEKNYKESEIQLEIVDSNMWRGTQRKNFVNYMSQSSGSDADITWIDVGKASDIVFGIFIALVMVTVHVLYVVDVTVGLPWAS